MKSFKLRWKYADDNRMKIVPINFDYRHRPRRQDWDGEFIEAGMFYFTKRELLNEGLFQNDKYVNIFSTNFIEAFQFI